MRSAAVWWLQRNCRLERSPRASAGRTWCGWYGAADACARAVRRWRLVERRQELDGDGDLRLAAAAWRGGGAVQGTEHVEPLVPLSRRRRDRPRPGDPGRGVRPGARACDEPNPVEAVRRTESGSGQWRGLEDAGSTRILRARR